MPWILYGGSLAGAQTAFAVKTYGDILWGGIAVSSSCIRSHIILRAALLIGISASMIHLQNGQKLKTLDRGS